MASGVPVVASTAEGNRDLLVPGVTGCAVDRRDPKAFARAIEALLANPSRRADLAAEALVHARSFSWSRALERAEVLLACAARGERPVFSAPTPPPPTLLDDLGLGDETIVVCPIEWTTWAGKREKRSWPEAERHTLAIDDTRPRVLAGPLHTLPDPARILRAFANSSADVHLVVPARDYHGPSPPPGHPFPFSRPEVLAVARAAFVRLDWYPLPPAGWHLARLQSA
jgi:hypothetical protein